MAVRMAISGVDDSWDNSWVDSGVDSRVVSLATILPFWLLAWLPSDHSGCWDGYHMGILADRIASRVCTCAVGSHVGYSAYRLSILTVGLAPAW